jgi:hypothetical protein
MMVSRSAQLYMAAALLAAAGPVTGLAADRPGNEWSGGELNGDVYIYYGLADGDPTEAPFFLYCNNEKNRATFTFHQEEGTKVGEPPSVELAAGPAKASLTGIVSPPDEDGHTFFETIVDGVKPVVAVLQASGALTVKIGETSATLPEQGRAAVVNKFAKACKVE